MKQYIFKLLEDIGDLSLENIVLNIMMAAAIGFMIFISYKISHMGTIYSKKFNVTLITLTTLTATVMTVIGNNIALSLGMVGALSIVRFRTAIKDSRDTAYIFWAIIVGICCGVGDYVIASVGSGITFFILLILGTIRNDHRILLIIRAGRNSERNIEAVVFRYFKMKAQMRVKNTTEESVELIYELAFSTYNKNTRQNEKNITEALYETGNIEYVNIVTQNDEIGS